MTPVETRPTPTSTTPDQRLLDQVMACDAFVHSSSARIGSTRRLPFRPRRMTGGEAGSGFC